MSIDTEKPPGKDKGSIAVTITPSQVASAQFRYAGKLYRVLDASPAMFAAWVRQQLPRLALSQDTIAAREWLHWAADDDRDERARLLCRWYVLQEMLMQARRRRVALPLVLP